MLCPDIPLILESGATNLGPPIGNVFQLDIVISMELPRRCLQYKSGANYVDINLKVTAVCPCNVAGQLSLAEYPFFRRLAKAFSLVFKLCAPLNNKNKERPEEVAVKICKALLI
jgi:hypothetical protein